MSNCLRHLALLSAWILPLWLAGCATGPAISRKTAPLLDTQAWAAASTIEGATSLGEWEHYVLPTKRATQFSANRQHGRNAMKAQAQSSASMLRRKLRIESAALGTVHFSWRVEALMPQANMALSHADDSPVRVVLVFDGDRSKFSMRNAMLSEMAHAITGEPLPYATLVYSWCMRCTVGDVIKSPRTDRIRTKVLEAGADGLGAWKDYSRNIKADFEAVFGEPPGALLAVGVMTDADNTDSHATAWYGPIKLFPPNTN